MSLKDKKQNIAYNVPTELFVGYSEKDVFEAVKELKSKFIASDKFCIASYRGEEIIELIDEVFGFKEEEKRE